MWVVHVEGVWVNKKDSFVFHLQKKILFITEEQHPEMACGLVAVCHPPCKLMLLCWPTKDFQYLLREL